MANKLNLQDERDYFKPFSYPWAYEAWLKHEQSHWLHTEVPMIEDVKDWKTKITAEQKYFLTNIFRFFTQGDIDVAGGYVNNYLPYFPQPEIRMMLSGFAAREALHIAAYSHLIETLGMPENTYQEFAEYQEMSDKHEYFMKLSESNGNKRSVATNIAAFSAFTEGMQLFSSFIMLLNFPRHGLMKGMGQIVTWSVRDETLHCNSMIRLFKEFINENPHIWTPQLKKELYEACRTIVHHEDAFIDLAFEMGPMNGLTAQEVKDYIRFIGNRRLAQLGLEPIYDVQKNPLTWLDTMLNAVEHMNFFEGRATECSKASTTTSETPTICCLNPT